MSISFFFDFFAPAAPFYPAFSSTCYPSPLPGFTPGNQQKNRCKNQPVRLCFPFVNATRSSSASKSSPSGNKAEKSPVNGAFFPFQMICRWYTGGENPLLLSNKTTKCYVSLNKNHNILISKWNLWYKVDVTKSEHERKLNARWNWYLAVRM